MNIANDHNACPINGLTFAPEWSGTNIFLKSLPVADYMHELYANEHPYVENAAAIRRHTFSSGRYCARSLMLEAGLPATILLRRANGAVLWPEGLIGSLSHTDEWAVAAIALPAMCEAKQMGIDLERIKPLDDNVVKLIAHGAEREELAVAGAPEWHATALFSFKESLYKCLASEYGQFINFYDVEFTGLAGGRPSLRFKNASLAGRYCASQLELRMAVTPLHVFTLIWLRSD